MSTELQRGNIASEYGAFKTSLSAAASLGPSGGSSGDPPRVLPRGASGTERRALCAGKVCRGGTVREAVSVAPETLGCGQSNLALVTLSESLTSVTWRRQSVSDWPGADVYVL